MNQTMALRKYATLNQVASIFRVHPRTILRAIEGKHNVYWTDEDFCNEQRILLEQVATAYNTTVKTLNVVLDGRDELINPARAATVLGIADRTFRERKTAGRYTKIGSGGIARYLHSKIVTDLIATNPDFA